MKDTLGARVGLFRLELASTCAGHIQETCCYWADVQRKGKGLGEERSLSLSLWSFPTRLGLSSCLGKQIDHPQCHMQRNHLHEYRRNPARVSAHVIKKNVKSSTKGRMTWNTLIKGGNCSARNHEVPMSETPQGFILIHLQKNDTMAGRRKESKTRSVLNIKKCGHSWRTDSAPFIF